MALSGWHPAPLASTHSPKAAVKSPDGIHVSSWGWCYFIWGGTSCGTRPCMVWFNVITPWNSSTGEEMCTPLVRFVCLCVGGEWITPASPRFGRGTLLVLRMRESKRNKHQLLSQNGFTITWSSLTTISLCTILFVLLKCFSFSLPALFSPGGPWFTSNQWISHPPMDRPLLWTGLTLLMHLYTSCMDLSIQITTKIRLFFVHPGASHRLLNRLGIRRGV